MGGSKAPKRTFEYHIWISDCRNIPEKVDQVAVACTVNGGTKMSKAVGVESDGSPLSLRNAAIDHRFNLVVNFPLDMDGLPEPRMCRLALKNTKARRGHRTIASVEFNLAEYTYATGNYHLMELTGEELEEFVGLNVMVQAQELQKGEAPGSRPMPAPQPQTKPKEKAKPKEKEKEKEKKDKGKNKNMDESPKQTLPLELSSQEIPDGQKSQVVALQQKVEDLTNALQLAWEAVASGGGEASKSLEQELQRLNEYNRELQDELDAREEVVNELRAQLRERERSVNEYRTRADASERELATLRRQNQQLLGEVSSLKSSLANMGTAPPTATSAAAASTPAAASPEKEKEKEKSRGILGVLGKAGSRVATPSPTSNKQDENPFADDSDNESDKRSKAKVAPAQTKSVAKETPKAASAPKAAVKEDNPFGDDEEEDNPFVDDDEEEEEDNPFGRDNDNPFGGDEKDDNPFGDDDEEEDNPFGRDEEESNPFAKKQEKKKANPFSDDEDEANPFSDEEDEGNPFGNEKTNPFSDDEKANPFSDDEKANPFSDDEKANPFSDEEDVEGNPFAEPKSSKPTTKTVPSQKRDASAQDLGSRQSTADELAQKLLQARTAMAEVMNEKYQLEVEVKELRVQNASLTDELTKAKIKLAEIALHTKR